MADKGKISSVFERLEKIFTILKLPEATKTAMRDKSDYHCKLQTILKDKNKFTKLNHNSSNQLKSKINKLINANNADLHNIKLPKIIGHYKPG